MKHIWTTLHVKNLAASAAFYQEIFGMEIARQIPPTGEPHIVFLQNGDVQLELLQDDSGAFSGKGISMGFRVDSLEDTLVFLSQRGVMPCTCVQQPGPSIRFFYIQDPDGFMLQIVEEK